MRTHGRMRQVDIGLPLKPLRQLDAAGLGG